MKDFLKPLFNGQSYQPGSFFLLAGPCVVESREGVWQVAVAVKEICERLGIPYVFKASYRKANRSSAASFTGLGDAAAGEILQQVRHELNLPVVTDIHTPEEAARAAEFADVLQIPAFLCRQSDLLVAAAKTGKIINIKKGQFLSGPAMQFALDKVFQAGNDKVILTERGTTFGYQDLVVDMRNIPWMQQTEAPVVMDVTHSLQQPNQAAGITGGRPDMIETIALAALAAGADGLFIETHPNPAAAKSDGANMLPLHNLEQLLRKSIAVRNAILQ
ncbi:MAG: 3-deoxy-8-phosphooctulonate synthase [Bacteroidetes bacterium]|nr:3-deoxy-8-phosphooctulonate synthase [Bacteroidota bacterium]